MAGGGGGGREKRVGWLISRDDSFEVDINFADHSINYIPRPTKSPNDQQSKEREENQIFYSHNIILEIPGAIAMLPEGYK